MAFAKVNLRQLAQDLSRPFMLHEIARLDHFALYLYLARGAIAPHRHQLYDELFYTVTGSLKLESASGSVVIQEGEFALVPKGVEHMSSSLHNSTILMAQAKADPERKNGHGGMHPNQQAITRITPRSVTHGLSQTFFSVALGLVDEMALRAAWCQGQVNWHRHPDHDELLLVVEGQLEVVTDEETIVLHDDELVIISRNIRHQLRTQAQTLLISMVHADISPSTQMGYTS
ncbi:MAG: cupin domain-containing protein [Anaerolineae bacterium]